MTRKRVIIQWTRTAREGLKGFPKKVRRGIFAEVDKLYETADPRKAHKAMRGPLQGLYSMVYSRYRVLYAVDEEKADDDSMFVHVRIRFVIAGIRKENDKHDVYVVAQKLVDLGVLKIHGDEDHPDEPIDDLTQ